MKRLVSVAAASTAAVFLFSACARGGYQGRRGGGGGMVGQQAAIPTTTVHVATIHPAMTISGIIAPFQNVMLSSTLNEPAAAVNVNEGDRVYKGEVLAVLDTSDMQAQLQSLQASANSSDLKAQQVVYTAQQTIAQDPNNVLSARAALKQAQANLGQALADLKRDQTLEQKGYISVQQLQTQETLVAVDTANERSAQASLDSSLVVENTNGTMHSGLQATQIASAQQDAASSRAQARQIAAQIARATIASPVNGIVVNRNLNPGEFPGARTLFVVQQNDPVYAELNASSADVFRVKTGDVVSLSIPGEPGGGGMHGAVVGVLGQVQPGSTNFTVKVLVPGTGGKLAAGLPVTGVIGLAGSTGVGIPSTAFLDDSHTSIMADVKGTATEVKVRELATDGTTSIVSGLRKGETIISNGQLGIAPGTDLDTGL